MSFTSRISRLRVSLSVVVGLASVSLWGCNTTDTNEPNTTNNKPGISGYMYFTSNFPGTKVYKFNLASGEFTELFAGNGASVTPEGTIVTQSGELNLVERNGASERVIVEYNSNDGFENFWNDAMQNPRVSPSGELVAYDTYINGSVFVVDRESGDVISGVVKETSDEEYIHPNWTRDNRLLVEGSGYGNKGIWLSNADLTEIVRIDPNMSRPQYPAASPVSDQVAFVSDGDVWVMNLDGTGLRKLAEIFGEERWPQWSPDGKWIVCHGGSDQTYLIPVNGGTVRKMNDLYTNFKFKSSSISSSYGIDWSTK